MNPEGRLLHDRYRVLSQIGSGGQGSVWLSEDTLLERRVALKKLVPPGEGADLDESRARALIEARALARVKHRCIVRVHDFFVVDRDTSIVMEYICGRSLADIVAADPLTEREIAAIGLSVLDGLQAVHAARVLHRDVKPRNILVDQEGAIFLVDFGIAKIAEDVAAATKRYIDNRARPCDGRAGCLERDEYTAIRLRLPRPVVSGRDLVLRDGGPHAVREGQRAAHAGPPVSDPLRGRAAASPPGPPGLAGPAAAGQGFGLAPEPEPVYRVLETMSRRPRPRRPPGTDRRPTAFPESSKVMFSTDAMAFTETMPRLEFAERARHGIADAVRDVNPSGGDSGVAQAAGQAR